MESKRDAMTLITAKNMGALIAYVLNTEVEFDPKPDDFVVSLFHAFKNDKLWVKDKPKDVKYAFTSFKVTYEDGTSTKWVLTEVKQHKLKFMIQL